MTSRKIVILFKSNHENSRSKKGDGDLFKELEAEMVLKGLTQGQVAKEMGITPTTLSLKLNGKSPISLRECMQIKNIIGSSKTIDVLFCTTQPTERKEE